MRFSSRLQLAAWAGVFLLCPLRGAAAQLSPSPERSPRDSILAGKRISATRIALAPRIDGLLDDSAWAHAQPARDFVQKEPVAGATPTDRLEVAFAYDDDALYVMTRVRLAHPRDIRAPMSRHDNLGAAEHIWISLDTYRDRRTAYTFGISASGVRADRYHPGDSENQNDSSWDPVWSAATHTDSTGWTSELRIPFSQLRFVDTDVQRWGVNVNHWTPSTNEDVYWVAVPKSEAGWSSWMGELDGIRGIRHTRRLELLPYVASDARVNADRNPANPFDNGLNAHPRIGGDLKMGIGPGLTLQATVNPDFGQVEADPAVVNLSAFETIFPERRPFFVEGSQLLQGSGGNYFYSRRIGGRPRGPASGTFVDYPDASPILGAAKVTGRLPQGMSLGLLTAVTGAQRARYLAPNSTSVEQQPVAPRTAYMVGRVQQEFGDNASTVGLSFTGTGRSFSADDQLRRIYDDNALTGGLDFNYRLDGNAYNVQGFVGGSLVRGDTAAIAMLQRSSARYFQRPDARSYSFDPSRTSLAGFTAALSVNRNAGTHWLWGLGASTESPQLELNDVGRISTADGHAVNGMLRYRETRPNAWLHAYGVSLSQSNEWNYDGDRQNGQLSLSSDMTLRNFWQMSGQLSHNFRALDERATRGGPLMGTGYFDGISAQLSNSYAAEARWTAAGSYGKDEFGASASRMNGSFSMRPAPEWELSVSPSFARTVTSRQYVATLGGGSADTFGKRYVFGRIDQSTFYADLRVNYTFDPDVTLEMYAEPFAASGRFSDFGELAAARSRELRPYGSGGVALSRDASGAYVVSDSARTDANGQPTTARFRADDFGILSMRSNAVLRWEYRPGSTLFVVWQQNRALDDPSGDLVSFDDVARSFGPKASNYFAVKLNYWLPVM